MTDPASNPVPSATPTSPTSPTDPAAPTSPKSASPDARDTPAPPKRRKWLKRILIAVPLVLVAGFLLFQFVLFSMIVKGVLKEKLGVGEGAVVEVDSVRYGFPLSAEIEGLRVFAPNSADKPPVLNVPSARVRLDGLPIFGGKLSIAEARVTPHVVIAETAGGPDTLKLWLDALARHAAKQPPTSPDPRPLSEILGIGRAEIAGGSVTWLPLGAEPASAAGLQKLDVVLTGADARICNLTVAGDLGPAGKIDIRGKLDLQELALSLAPESRADLELSPAVIAKLPAAVAARLNALKPAGKLAITFPKGEIPLRNAAAADWRIVAKVEGGAVRPTEGVDIAGAAGELSVDSKAGVKLAIAGTVNGEPVDLTADILRQGDYPWHLKLSHKEAGALDMAGRLTVPGGKPAKLSVELLSGKFDLSAKVFAAARNAAGKPLFIGAGGTVQILGGAQLDVPSGVLDRADLKVIGLKIGGEYTDAGVRAAGVDLDGWVTIEAGKARGMELHLRGRELVRETMSAEQLVLDITSDGARNVSADAKLNFCGGPVAVRAKAVLPEAAGGPVAFSGDADVRGVRIDRLAAVGAKPGDKPADIHGLLDVKCAFAGTDAGIEAVTVTGGTLALREGQVAGLPVFKEIGRELSKVLAITPFKGLLDQTVQTEFVMQGGVLTLSKVVVTDPLIRLECPAGTMKFVRRAAPATGYDAGLDFAITAHPSAAVPAIPGLDKVAGKVAAATDYTLPIKVSGTLDAPSVVPGVPTHKSGATGTQNPVLPIPSLDKPKIPDLTNPFKKPK